MDRPRQPDPVLVVAALLAVFGVAIWFIWGRLDLRSSAEGSRQGYTAGSSQDLGSPPALPEQVERRELAPSSRSELFPEFDGLYELHGRIVTPAGAPIADARIEAFPWSVNTHGPPQRSAVSASDGTFVFMRMGSWFRVVVEKVGYLRLDRRVEEQELGVSAPPADFVLQPLVSAELRVRAVTPTGATVSDGRVAVTPHGRDPLAFEAFLASGTTPDSGLSAKFDSDGMAFVSGVPAGFAIDVTIRKGHSDLLTQALDPLDDGEIRMLELVVSNVVEIKLDFIDSSDGTRIDWKSRGGPGPGPGAATIEWNAVAGGGDRAWHQSILEQDIPPLGQDQVSESLQRHTYDLSNWPGFFAVPGPGELWIRCWCRGYEAVETSVIVDSISRIEIPLTRRRLVQIRFTDENGTDLVFDESAYQQLPPNVSVAAGSAFLPSIDVGAWSIEEGATPVDRARAKIGWGNRPRWMRASSVGVRDLSRADMYLPNEDLVVGGFVDGSLAGSTLIPKEASTATIALTIPRPETGSLRLAALDRESLKPIQSFHCWLFRRGVDASASKSMRFIVSRSAEGEFSINSLLAGEYFLRIPWGLAQPIAYWQWVSVRPGERVDLGEVLCARPTPVELIVVDESGNPVAGAEVRVHSEELRAWVPTDELSVTTPVVWRTNRRGRVRAKIPAGPSRIEARAVGWAAAAESLEVTPGASNGTVLTLRRGVGATCSPALLRLASSHPGCRFVEVGDADSGASYGAFRLTEPRPVVVPPAARLMVRFLVDEQDPVGDGDGLPARILDQMVVAGSE